MFDIFDNILTFEFPLLINIDSIAKSFSLMALSIPRIYKNVFVCA